MSDLERVPLCRGRTRDWNSGVVGCVCVHAEIRSEDELRPEVDEHHKRQVAKPSFFHRTLLFLDLLEEVRGLFRHPLDAVTKPAQFWPSES